jgi:hypothetical protein
MASLLGVNWRGIPLQPGAASGPAQNTAQKSKPAGEGILTPERLLRRGLTIHNRREAGAKQYAAVHLMLMGKGASCDT